MNKAKLTGAILAVGAAAAFAIAPAVSTAHAGHHKDQCWGVNACKGKSSCKGKDGSSCKGKNDCKGKGWVKMSSATCDQIGGKMEE